MPLYPQSLNWTATVKAKLLLDSYAYSATHRYLDDVDSHDAGETDETLTVTFTYSEAEQTVSIDLTDPTWTAITVDNVGYIVVYEDTGVAATSPLKFYLDIRDGGAGRDLINADLTYQFDATGAWKGYL